MRVLIIKTSSMGDVIHTLPALTDASRAISSIQFDWIVEENFAEIPGWHPFVKKIIPVALRRWRKNLFARNTRREFNEFRKQLTEKYDLIIDAQGLLKSAWLVWMAKGMRCGLNWVSAREPLASLFYQRKLFVGKIKEVHAVTRMRKLFSHALNYSISQETPDYGIDRQQFISNSYDKNSAGNYVVFLHGTTWATKHWPEIYWTELARLLSSKNIFIKIAWGNMEEFERAKRIASAAPDHASILPRMKLADIAQVLARANIAIAGDTGLGHLAAALDVPTISLYGPTHAELTGALGRSQIHLSAQFPCSPCLSQTCLYRPDHSYAVNPPCFSTITPERVMAAFLKTLS